MKSKSYLEILNDLMAEVASDNIPKADEEKIYRTIKRLFDLLWKYSD